MITLGTHEFSKLVGTTKQTLATRFKDGSIPAQLNSKNQRTYPVSHFLLPAVVALMNKSGKTIPTSIMREIFGLDAEIAPKSPVDPSKTAPLMSKTATESENIPITSLMQLKELPEGLLTRVINPISGISNQLAADIWHAILPGLIEMNSFYKADCFVLLNYANIQSQIFTMELQLGENYIDEFGKPSPLLAALDKCRVTVKAYGLALNLSALGRKNFKLPEKADESAIAWANILAGKNIVNIK